MVNGRNKGAAAEREIARLLFDELGVRSIRNLEQCRNGGHDLIPEPGSCLEPFAMEVKRYARVTHALLQGFWLQTVEQAQRLGKIPVLLFRGDREDWRVVLPLEVINPEITGQHFSRTATVSVAAFCYLVRHKPGRVCSAVH